MSLPARIRVVEVGPRDGFQVEAGILPTALKVETVDALAAAGLSKIETTAFVNPKVVPQMADAAEVLSRIFRRPGTAYTALVPNLKGAERAIESRADGLRLVVCATESYNRRNVGLSVDESVEACGTIAAKARAAGVSFEAIVGLAFGCPLEGEVLPGTVLALCRRLAAAGVSEISVADSVGLANPAQVGRTMAMLRDALPGVPFSLHLHDTRGLGLANVLAALGAGVDTFDSSLGGLGGCPVFPGATGNIGTEDLVNLCDEMGIGTGVDLEGVAEASRRVAAFLGRTLPSRVLAVGTRRALFSRIQKTRPVTTVS